MASLAPWWWSDFIGVVLASGVVSLMCTKLRCFCRKTAEGHCECGAGYISEGVSIIPGEKVEDNECCCCHGGICKAIAKFITSKANEDDELCHHHHHNVVRKEEATSQSKLA